MSFIKYLRTTLLQNTCFFTEHSQKLEFLIHSDFRGSRSQMLFKISTLKNFAIFIEKHLCWGVLLIKLQAWRPATLLKTHMFSCEINFLRTAFSIEQAAFVTFKWRTTRDVLEKCVFPSGGYHAATTGLFVLQGKVFQMQTSWYSSRSKDVIKHVQK